MMKRYLLNVLTAFDQLGNALTGGDPDETISSRLGKAWRGDYGPLGKKLAKPFRWVVNCVFFWQKDHTGSHIEEDEGSKRVL